MGGRGVLSRDERPAVWQMEEEFVGPDGVARKRRGLVARVRLEPYGARIVLPHERVFPGPAASRLRLIRATRTKLSPVLLLHDGPSPAPLQGKADLEATLEGTTTRLWRIADAATIETALATLRPPYVIADGHHRYDAALRFHEEEGTDPSAYVMAAFVARSDPGLTIFPTHRLVSGPAPVLNGSFRVSQVGGGAREGYERLQALARDHPAFVLVARDRTVLAEGSGTNDPLERLDVSTLEKLALEGVSFTPSLSEVEDAVSSGRVGSALLVRAPTVDEVEAIARAGRTMPQKSTYFSPKLVSGLLLSPFDE